ncbi:hypothetical protein X907_0969 [Glycocaulis alkaliphilus]|uniref:Uncharacterized protein n=1 Tax=Glycocaulis alkaliphilus TaxID=1434191 RepID=A0A3T0E877_9PROT|nr:hypothetical protein X907_0969 [Glycocaulis alkaliphilus]
MTRRVQRINHPWRRVRLHGVENFTRKMFLEPAGRYGQTVRPRARDRAIDGPKADQVQGRMVLGQLTRPPVSS